MEVDPAELGFQAAINLMGLQPLPRQTPQNVQSPDKWKYLYLVEDFKQNVQLSSLLEAAINPSDEAPLNSILYGDLQLKFQEGIQDKPLKTDIRPLKNFLFGKQKGIGHSKSAFEVFPSISQQKILFSLKFDYDLINKIANTMGNAQVHVKLEIEGLEETNPAPQQPRLHRFAAWPFPWMDTMNADIDIDSLSTGYVFKNDTNDYRNSSRVREMMDDTPPRKIFLLCEKQLTKEKLENENRNSNLTFSWSISIEFSGQHSFELDPFGQCSEILLRSMYELPESTKDFVILANNGAEIKCHKIVLMVQSASFHSMLSPDNKMIEGDTGRISWEENSADGIELFLKYLYGFEIPPDSLYSDSAVEIFQLANKYQVKRLEEYFVDFLTRKFADWFTVDSLLELYFYSRNVETIDEVKTHALIELSSLGEEKLNESEYFNKLTQEDRMSLLFKLREWK